MLNSFVKFQDFSVKYLDIFKFFTTWVVFIVLFHPYTKDVFNLHLLAIVLLAGGAYISFVTPRKYVVRFGSREYTFDGVLRLITIDILFHLFMFLFIVETYWQKYELFDVRTANSILLGITYLMFINVRKAYMIEENDVRNILISVLMTFVLFNIITKTVS